MHRLRRTDAYQDAQDFPTRCSLRHRRIKAVATLFDGGEMEGRRIRDRLQESGIGCVGIGSRNCRVLPNEQTWDYLREGVVWIKIRVMAVVAVASPPTGIQRKLGQVSKPFPDQGGVDTGGGAAHQSAKRIEISWSRSFRNKIRVEEVLMREFVISVVVDVHVHVLVQNQKRVPVLCIDSSAWNLGVWDSSEFVILNPKVGLEYFRRRREPEQCRVSRC